jgi:hypothetical protein
LPLCGLILALQPTLYWQDIGKRLPRGDHHAVMLRGSGATSRSGSPLSQVLIGIERRRVQCAGDAIVRKRGVPALP